MIRYDSMFVDIRTLPADKFKKCKKKDTPNNNAILIVNSRYELFKQNKRQIEIELKHHHYNLGLILFKQFLL